MLVDIDDVIVNDVDMALEELLEIYYKKIDEMENVLKGWRYKIKNYGVKRSNVFRSEIRSRAIAKVNSKKIVKIYPREMLEHGYSISEFDKLKKYASNIIQFGGRFREELRESTVTYITSILRCGDEELLENIFEIKKACPCKSLFSVWDDIQKYLDLRIKIIKLEKLRNGLAIEDDSKEKGHQKVLSKKKPEA